MTKVSLAAGTVRVRHVERVKNTGNVPERGTLTWRIYDRSGRLIKKGSTTLTIYPGKTRTLTTTTILGSCGAPRRDVQAEGPVRVEGRPLEGARRRFRQPY